MVAVSFGTIVDGILTTCVYQQTGAGARIFASYLNWRSVLHVRTTLRPAAFSHRRVLARLQLPDRRSDLPDGESAPAPAAAGGAHQAAPARPLGDIAGAEFCLCASQPADWRARRQRHLYFRSRPRR